MTQSNLNLSLTMNPVFLEDYFVRASFYEHQSCFWPLSAMSQLNHDYLERFQSVLENPDQDYIDRLDHNVFEIEENGMTADPLFHEIGNFFPDVKSIYSMSIILCFGWRFEYLPTQADGSKMIHMPWQVCSGNDSKEKAQAHLHQVLTGKKCFEYQDA